MYQGIIKKQKPRPMAGVFSIDLVQFGKFWVLKDCFFLGCVKLIVVKESFQYAKVASFVVWVILRSNNCCFMVDVALVVTKTPLNNIPGIEVVCGPYD